MEGHCIYGAALDRFMLERSLLGNQSDGRGCRHVDRVGGKLFQPKGVILGEPFDGFYSGLRADRRAWLDVAKTTGARYDF